MKKTMIAVLVSLMVVGCSGNGDDANKEWKPVTGPVHYTDDISGHYIGEGFSVDIKKTAPDSFVIEAICKPDRQGVPNTDVKASLKKIKSNEDFYTKGKFTWYGSTDPRVNFYIHDDVGLKTHANYEMDLVGIPSTIRLKKVY